ncbi:MAG: LapA family protein [Candidatus Eisenbacteria bacterium]
MRTVLFIALLILTVILLIQNTAPVAIRLLFWKITMSRAVFAFVLVLIGFLVGFLTSKLRGRFFRL